MADLNVSLLSRDESGDESYEMIDPDSPQQQNSVVVEPAPVPVGNVATEDEKTPVVLDVKASEDVVDEKKEKEKRREERRKKEAEKRIREDRIFYRGLFIGAVLMVFALRLRGKESSSVEKTPSVGEPNPLPSPPSPGLLWERFPVGDDYTDRRGQSSKLYFYGFKGFRQGARIRIVGVPKANGEKFAVDLVTGRNQIALHFNPRFFSEKEREGGTCTSDCVVRNHAVEKKGELHWDFDKEETDGGFPFARGQTFTLDFVRGNGHIEILVNGKHFTDFVERLKPTYDMAYWMEIQGVHVHSVAYYG